MLSSALLPWTSVLFVLYIDTRYGLWWENEPVFIFHVSLGVMAMLSEGMGWKIKSVTAGKAGRTRTETPDLLCFYVIKKNVQLAHSGWISRSAETCHGMVVTLVAICPFLITFIIILFHQIFWNCCSGGGWNRDDADLLQVQNCTPSRVSLPTPVSILFLKLFIKALHENKKTVPGAENDSKRVNLFSYFDALLSIAALLMQGWEYLCVLRTPINDSMVPLSSWVCTSPPFMSYRRSWRPCLLM